MRRSGKHSRKSSRRALNTFLDAIVEGAPDEELERLLRRWVFATHDDRISVPVDLPGPSEAKRRDFKCKIPYLGKKG
ncbi:MAG: hypothetical protein H6970_12505 [Gammaproteobacteria bacterium]|nr:hypothetical protein [Gammaproteobacteria bacterium]